MEFNSSEIKQKYDAVNTEKQDGDNDVILQAIKDKKLNSVWKKIKEERNKIETTKEFEKYQKKLNSFFGEVCSIITSPGVEKIIDWIEDLDPKFPLGKNHKKWLHKYLEEKYSTHNEEIKNILSIINLFKSNDSLFEGTKSSTKTVIAKTICNFDSNTREEFNRELPSFIADLNEMADEVSEIIELKFKNVTDFYTLNFDENLNDKFEPRLDLHADYYSELIEKIVENKDYLTTDKSKMSISIIGDKIQENIVDIYQSIKHLKSLDISEEQNKDVVKLYNKFEQSFNFQRSNGNISEALQVQIDEVWYPTLRSYESINNFFDKISKKTIDEFKVEMTKMGKERTQVQSILTKYIKRLENVIMDNPLETFHKIKSINDIFKSFGEKAEDIRKIEAGKTKDELISHFKGIINEFKTKKIEMLNNWNIDEKKIESIKDELSGIQTILITIEREKVLIQTLNKEFDGLMISCDKISDDFTKHCKEKGINEETLSYFDNLTNEGNIDFDKFSDESEISKIKTLLKNGLIQISILKNV